jgi:DedD protein
MTERTSVRNLELIQEADVIARTPRGVTIALVALGAGCVVFAGLALSGRRAESSGPKPDPLGELVVMQQAKVASSGQKATELSSKDVTFPSILSDEASPPTALAAVKGNPVKKAPSPADSHGELATVSDGLGKPFSGEAPVPSAPPPATDRLPVVPLPAQTILDATPVVTRPRDSLTRAATDAAQSATSTQTPSTPGKDGGYQLQVSSFRAQPEAEQFAEQLRARGHKAHVVEARVPNRGTWYRVRIGPFPSQHAAASYRQGFEGREHVVPFIIQPQAK